MQDEHGEHGHTCAKHNTLAKWLLEHNSRQSGLYVADQKVRDDYRNKYPTEILALKCMDGRLHLPMMTDTPMGMIQPFRNLGGEFNLGWYPFQKELYEWMTYARRMGRDCLVLVTYHYSKSARELGCKGFNYDTDLARATAIKLSEKLRQACKDSFVPLYAIVVGIETDADTLTLHGYDTAQKLSMLDCLEWTGEKLFAKLQKLYPGMSRRVIRDLLPLVQGNIRHTGKLQRKPREIKDVYHNEQVLIVGRGVDWLHKLNFALIVGPFSYNLRTPILQAGKILLGNLKDGRIPKKDGIVLMASALHRREVLGVEQAFAAEKALTLAEEALTIIREEIPELAKHLCPLVGTTNMETRFFSDHTNRFYDEVLGKKHNG